MKMHRCSEAGCRTLVPVGQRYCAIHEPLHRRKVDPRTYKRYDRERNADGERKERHDFYNKSAWKRTAKAIREEHPMCGYCELWDRVTPGEMVDHIVPREFDRSLELDTDNLITSCKACHVLKTNWEQGYYGTGQGNCLRSDAIPIKSAKLIAFVFECADE